MVKPKLTLDVNKFNENKNKIQNGESDDMSSLLSIDDTSVHVKSKETPLQDTRDIYKLQISKDLNFKRPTDLNFKRPTVKKSSPLVNKVKNVQHHLNKVQFEGRRTNLEIGTGFFDFANRLNTTNFRNSAAIQYPLSSANASRKNSLTIVEKEKAKKKLTVQRKTYVDKHGLEIENDQPSKELKMQINQVQQLNPQFKRQKTSFSKNTFQFGLDLNKLKSHKPKNTTLTTSQKIKIMMNAQNKSEQRKLMMKGNWGNKQVKIDKPFETNLQALVKNQSKDIDEFLQPKIDVGESMRKQQISYRKHPGPMEDLDGELLNRSVVGSKDMVDAALDLQEKRQNKIDNEILQAKREALGSGSSNLTRRLSRIGLGPQINVQNVETGRMSAQSFSRRESQASQLNSPNLKNRLNNDEEIQRNLKNQQFDNLCYLVTRRVQENKDIENEKRVNIYDQINKNELKLNLKNIQTHQTIKMEHIINLNEDIMNKQKKKVDQAKDLNPLIKLDPFNIPTTVIGEHRKIVKENNSGISFSMQLKDSKEERRLINHQKYLEKWDLYEKQVYDHFEEKKLLPAKKKTDKNLEIVDKLVQLAETIPVEKAQNDLRTIPNVSVDFLFGVSISDDAIQHKPQHREKLNQNSIIEDNDDDLQSPADINRLNRDNEKILLFDFDSKGGLTYDARPETSIGFQTSSSMTRNAKASPMGVQRLMLKDKKSSNKNSSDLSLNEFGAVSVRAEQALGKFKKSVEASKMMKQINDRSSIINQGDVYLQRKNLKEAMRLANFDKQRRIPEQIWYDSLRGSDDGSFIKKLPLKKRPPTVLDLKYINNPISTPVSPTGSLLSPLQFNKPSRIINPFNSKSRYSVNMVSPTQSFIRSRLVPEKKMQIQSQTKTNKNSVNNSPQSSRTNLTKSCLVSKSLDLTSSHKQPDQLQSSIQKPSNYNKLSDSFQHKFHQDAAIFGKPNLIINQQGMDSPHKYKNISLNKFSAAELVKIAENYSSNQMGQSQVVRKILERIDRENNQNEYTRTEIQDRKDYLMEIRNSKKYDMNQNRQVRLMESFDSQSSDRSYLQELKSQNPLHLEQTLNGFDDTNKFVYLQVQGKNQLFKEIEETQHMEDKEVHEHALHRNEMTGEVEENHDNIVTHTFKKQADASPRSKVQKMRKRRADMVQRKSSRGLSMNNVIQTTKRQLVDEMIICDYDKDQIYC